MTVDAQVPLISRAREPITFTVYGEPVPKHRPQFRIVPAKRGSGGPPCPHCKHHLMLMAYTTAEIEAAVANFRLQARKTVPRVAFRGAIRVELLFVRPVPVSWSARDKAAALAGAILPTSRPDIDNYVKFAYDAMNGFVWADDSVVCSESARKIYGLEPRTEVRITQMLEGEES